MADSSAGGTCIPEVRLVGKNKLFDCIISMTLPNVSASFNKILSVLINYSYYNNNYEYIFTFFYFVGVDDSQMPENVGALSLASTDETFPLVSFDQLQKHGQIQCEKFGNSVFSSCVFFTVNTVKNPCKKKQ